jgi:two-component system sensor histidine kinase RegB
MATTYSYEAEGVEAALPWLILLRWHAVCGQAIAIGACASFVRGLPVVWLLGSVAVLALSNVILALRGMRPVATRTAGLGAVLLFDCAQLTVQLALSGAATNPFAVLYLVELLVAVLVLPGRWIVTVTLTCLAGFTLLCSRRGGLEGLSPDVLFAGRWTAMALAMTMAAYMGARIAATLRERTEALARSLRLAASAEKLASLSSLAAGAAHELGTPLGTIAIASSELESLIESAPEEAIEEARAVRAEVDRCRAILARMSGRAGAVIGELPEPINAAAVLAMARHQLAAGDRARTRVGGELDCMVRCPAQSLAQVLAGLIANGLQASDDGAPVDVQVRADRGVVRFEVCDRGCGISADIRSRVGEPFFTTKPPGKGMGLGLFLAQTFAELCSGALEIVPAEDRGTRVALSLPLYQAAER